MKGHFSCRSITDFSPSAVQSATIQPQSRVLKGKPPWKEVRRAQHLLLTCSVLVRVAEVPSPLPKSLLHSCILQRPVPAIIPYSYDDNISGSQVGSLGSEEDKKQVRAGWRCLAARSWAETITDAEPCETGHHLSFTERGRQGKRPYLVQGVLKRNDILAWFQQVLLKSPLGVFLPGSHLLSMLPLVAP